MPESSTVKGPQAFRTIGEVAAELGIGQHILRYWEGKFPQLRPLQRAGNRRYYRPEDVNLARRIHRLLNDEGYTLRGVQALLQEKQAPQLIAEPPKRPEKELVDALKQVRADLLDALG